MLKVATFANDLYEPAYQTKRLVWGILQNAFLIPPVTLIVTDAMNQLLLPAQQDALLHTLKIRFEGTRPQEFLYWTDIQTKLERHPEKLWSLHEMERTGGQPNVIDYDHTTHEYLFYDCSPESPSGRRSVCYDREAQETRKEHKPEHNALDMAAAMGIEILTETQYRSLQKFGVFDTKTSSWIKTPPDVRTLGGALFADFRYGRVFVYHNGAQSYYAARAFRGLLRV